MDQALQALAGLAGKILPSAHVAADLPDAARHLATALGPGPFAAVVVFISPEANLPALSLALAAQDRKSVV